MFFFLGIVVVVSLMIGFVVFNIVLLKFNFFFLISFFVNNIYISDFNNIVSLNDIIFLIIFVLIIELIVDNLIM